MAWETNNELRDQEWGHRESGRETESKVAWDTDHKLVKELKHRLKERGSKDTDSIEWMERDPLPRRSPRLREIREREQEDKKEN